MLRRIIDDIILWLIGGTACILWRVVAEKEQILPYVGIFVCMALIWVVLGLVVGKYRCHYRDTWFWQEMLRMAGVVLVEWGMIYVLVPYLPMSYSMTVLYWVLGMVAVMDTLFILLLHYWKYAQNMTEPVMVVERRANAVCSRPDEQRSQASIETVHQSVLSLTTEDDYQMLVAKANLNSRQTKIVASIDRFGFMQLPTYQYRTIVDLRLLNDAKGINKRFCIVNQKLPDDGIFVCCYRPQEYIKTKILAKYPKGLNWLIYTAYFVVKRVIPRMTMTSRLYYDMTKGRKRMLSKTEILGRLYYCGFAVDEVVPMGHIEYIIAHRQSQPYPQEQLKLYGPLIKLPRVSKNREIVYFYKFRTMHPYSEYIQKYVFDQGGGMDIADKASNDWRITTWGRFFRRYWIDELPMLINFLKGDIKLVGIRPLSRTMFEEYPPELQDLRTKTKPGLIPPFYIDHPKTFDELFASEEKYLREYLAHPLWTDTKYFFLTIHSILFKRMHSA